MRRGLFLFLAFIVAIGCVLLIASFLMPGLKKADKVVTDQQKNQVVRQVEEPQQRVVVFTVAKNPGDTVNASTDLTITTMPASQLPNDVFTSMDVTSDSLARNRIDGWQVVDPVSPGQPAEAAHLKEAEKPQPQSEKPVLGNQADIDFFDKLESDPTIVLFDEDQLAGLALRADAVIDVSVESPIPAMDGNWYGRQIVVSGATLRAASLDVTGHGAKNVFYVKLNAKEADRVRAAASGSGSFIKVLPHRDEKALPPIGQICVGATCFEAMPDGYVPNQVSQDQAQKQQISDIASTPADTKSDKAPAQNAKPGLKQSTKN